METSQKPSNTAFLASGKLERAQKSAVLRSPHFCAAKKQKRLQRTESPTETLATQARRVSDSRKATGNEFHSFAPL